MLNEQNPLPAGEGQPAFDYREHMRQLSGELDTAVEAVVASEDTHADQQIKVARALEERDEVAERGFDSLLSAREGAFKRGGFEMAFVSGKTPRAPKRLKEQLGQSCKLLRDPAVEQRELKVKGFNIDLGEMADDLEARWLELSAALDHVDSANKVAENTMLANRETHERLRRTIVWVGRTVEGLFHLAGEDELAERIRTSTRRPLRPSERTKEPAPEASASEAPASEEPVSEAPASHSPVL